MDRVKQARRPVRAQLTKLINECKALLVADPVNKETLQVKLQVMQTLSSDLEEHDSKVVNAMLDEGLDEPAQDAEYQAITDYRENFTEIKIKIEKVLHPSESPADTEYETVSSAGEVRKQKNFKLPKIELRKFDGDIKNWLGWWNHFQKIHEREDIHDSDRILYLHQAMEPGSEPMELVNSYPQTAENYQKVVKALKERYGREDLLLQVYVRELLTLVISNVTAAERTPLAMLYLKLESHLRSLTGLNLDNKLLATILFPLVESSLTVETLKAWQRSSHSKEDGAKCTPPKTRLDLLMEFIKQEVESEQQITLAQSGFGKLQVAAAGGKGKNKKTSTANEVKNEEGLPTAASLISSVQTGCAFCDKKHDSDRCVKALSMTLEERKRRVQEKHLCFQCLKGGHSARKCRAFVRCALCSGKHYPILCPMSVTSSSNSDKSEQAEKPEKVTSSVENYNQCAPDVLLNTINVSLVDRSGTEIRVRLVGDGGSQRSFGKPEVIRQANCRKTGYEWLSSIVFGESTIPAFKYGKFAVPIRSLQGGDVKTFELLQKEKISGQLPYVPYGPWIEELEAKGITLNDVGEGYGDIDILLGNDYWGSVLTGNIIKLSCGLVAQETVFGWTLGGPVPAEAKSMAVRVMTLAVSSLDISGIWSLEAIGIKDPIEAKSLQETEQEAMEYFKKYVQKTESGYSTRLPWRDESTRPPSNYDAAVKRLYNTTRKLKKCDKIQDYHAVFMEWLKEGLIVKEEDDDKSGHYLPHRPVFKESSTTPVRPVFDASFRVGHSPSLNDTLHKGPNLLELIPILLLRFRENEIGVSADIRKAFQMLLVQECDQAYQKFLWWDSNDFSRMVVYKHRRVVFGMTCSPFLLGAVINYHLEKVDKELARTAEKLKNSYYVDNCVTSVNSAEEYKDFRMKAIEMMKGAGMTLRQWAHSASQELELCSSPDVEENLTEKSICLSVLGLLWHRLEDTLSCEIKEVTIFNKVTKREVLSVVSQVFDPVGFTCPALLLPKLLVQKTWINKFGWDEPLPEEMRKKFIKWKDELSLLREIKLPRLMQISFSTKKEVHTFVDASSDSYASVSFMRSELNGKVLVRMLTAKSRLAPIKKASIPRLELMACLIGVRQAELVRGAISTDNVTFHFWSDSSTALAWIRRQGDWGVFVGNRVKEICSSTKPEQWHHIPGIHNPADLPSRGCTPGQLLESRWWEGPGWMKLPKSEWPVSEEIIKEDEVNKELRATALTATATMSYKEPRFSSYRKNVAVWGWMLRFIRSCQGTTKLKLKYLTIDELRDAEKVLVKQVQQEAFPANTTSINGIAVIRDKENVLRVKTKLTNLKGESSDFVTPMLMPRKHPITEQLILDFHQHFGHGGFKYLSSKLREKYWIVQSTRTIGHVLRKCMRCRRHGSVPMIVEPAALPEKRVTIGEPFETTGVDLAGPLFLKDGTKAWIVLFTCAVFRGVHLDLVTSLSTEAFMGALERFICIVGRPCTLYSDNGTNFVGANHLFETLDWDSISEQSNARQIQWVFNPPTAAWWGGFWERLVRSAKDLLKRILGRAKLSYDEMRTCLAGVSAVMNDRPLTAVSENSGDLIPLTPNMFMRGKVAGVMEETSEAEMLTQSYRRMKRLQKEVQCRFRKEYLSQLVMVANEKKKNEPQVGDIVLIGSEGKKRYEWPIGMITKLCPGKDGNVRVAYVKTQKGILERPLQRLYPLEVSRKEEIPSVGETTEKVPVPPTRTKFGREVKAPARYGQWLHLVC